jgi:hypothetical protein
MNIEKFKHQHIDILSAIADLRALYDRMKCEDRGFYPAIEAI